MLEVTDLSAGYAGETVVSDLSFRIASTEILAVIGPSGVGKSTLIKAILGLIPSTGTVMLNSQSLAAKTHTLAFVPQNYGLLPWQTVRKNVQLGVQVKQHQRLTPAQTSHVDQLINTLGLTTIAAQYPGNISGGQQQRVALARAFAMAPDLLLLDEAFSALDLGLKAKAQQLFLDQWTQAPMSTLIVTHDLQEALTLSDQLLVMTPGQAHVRPNPLAAVERAQRPNSSALFAAEAALSQEVTQWQN
ncbi:ABC transporter ATP-binding protein [Lacticaseibacillus brantae]|uniref:Taurine-transporting ATPase n=1 Tax=Lacticaseibacillus brantae DSM 23927 TaxID=1423727 RepID=A0A0R2B5V0_9LACO|nr:ATP-binding cassette domain-containing protein [Lacticaseibacillus brantae]KRM71641.1 Taurine-transporting ATPase [Lacticaseibacillus brantae DSM 23927]